MKPFWDEKIWNNAVKIYLFYTGLWFSASGTIRFWAGMIHGDMDDHWVWFSRFVAGGILLGLSTLIKKEDIL